MALCLSGWARHAVALDARKAIGQYVHRSWESASGLPQNSINAIARTPDGYLWLATQDGIARFDGVRFVVFDTTTTPAFKSNGTNALLVDWKGDLWIGTDDGLVCYTGGRFVAFDTRNGLADNSAQSIHQDRAGTLWIGSWRGLSAMKKGAERFTPLTALAGERVLSVGQDRSGTMWIGTSGGLRRLAGETAEHVPVPGGRPNPPIHAIYQDADRDLWLGTETGLMRMVDGRLERIGAAEDVRSLVVDRDRNLWIGTYGKGLKRRVGATVSASVKPNALANDAVYSLFEDREGNLWVGTSGTGLHRLHDGRFTAFDDSPSATVSTVKRPFLNRLSPPPSVPIQRVPSRPSVMPKARECARPSRTV